MPGSGPSRYEKRLKVVLVVLIVVSALIRVFWTPLLDFFDSRRPKARMPASAVDEPGAPSAEVQEARREAMIEEQIEARGITDAAVLSALRAVPRHEFVPERYRHAAYEDTPLPIGLDQTISQPYIVARMTEAARVRPTSRALEIGTGSGYQAAVLAKLCREVYSIELLAELADTARERLERLGYANVKVRQGDGYLGWPEHAPFDVILVTCGASEVPRPLLEQLAPGGRLVIPVGPEDGVQRLRVFEKRLDGSFAEEDLGPVRFVPLVREKK